MERTIVGLGYLIDHLIGDSLPPPKFDAQTDDESLTTKQESILPPLEQGGSRLLQGWIIGTLFEEVLGLMVGLESSYQV